MCGSKYKHLGDRASFKIRVIFIIPENFLSCPSKSILPAAPQEQLF
jgi:hypothetical protein